VKKADLGSLNFGLATAWRKALLEMNGDVLWTQQRSSGVCYERNIFGVWTSSLEYICQL